LNKKLLPITFSILFIVSCGGGGGGGGGSPTTPSTPAPTVNLSAEPTSVLLESTSTLIWSSTNASSCSASWTTQTSTFGSRTVTITTAGNNSFSMTCSGDGGSRSASVTVEGYRNTEGVVVDGYISGAEVFIDEDDDWALDSNENSTTSDNNGKFTIKYTNGNLVSFSGTDLDSQTLLDNLLLTHKLTGHTDFKAVTPVTSIAAFMEDSSVVNVALGIDSSIDVFTFDPVANKGDGGINDYLYEKGNQLTVLAFALQNITNNLNTTTETTQDYFKAITEEIEKEYTETKTKVDIETEVFVTKVFDNVITTKSVTIDEAAKSNTVSALTGMLPVIQVKSEDDITTAVIRFAISTLQTDIQDIANGSASAETLKSYTEDLLNYIAEDQNIDVSEITPDISAIADSVLTSEDTEVEINVLLNDSYVISSPFSLSATNSTNGSTSISNSLITYSPNADYNGSDTFSYTLTQGDKASSADVTITIEAVNDAPSIDLASTIQVEENQVAVTTVSVSDVDDDDELTLTLGGADADSFNLSTENVLTFKEAPNYETKTSYLITLTLTDGTETVTKDVTITIIDVQENSNAPVITSSSTFTADENQTAIGTVTATDADGDTITYSISGSEITINSSSGVIAFASAPDFETKSSYTATVTASDGTNSTTQDITVNVTNLNDNNPVITSSSTFTVEENQTSVGSVTANDADGDSLTFALSGTDASLLSISSSGVITFNSAPDYETKTSYSITVSVSDGTNTTAQSVTVNITDENESPIISNLASTLSINENDTNVVTVSASDPENDNLTYSLSGTDASSLSINSSGVITFDSAPDYETKTSYSITVSVSDGTNTTSQSITINITNVNEPPIISNLANNISTDENDTNVVTVSASDPENDNLTYSLSGTDASSLSINSSGVITFDSAPDYETKTSYSITVNVSDGTNTTSQSITININDITENGSSGNDTINGGSGDDTILGLAGDDTINGNAGNDILRGGLDVDTINGGDGDDIISADECYGSFDIPFDDITTACGVATFGGQDLNGGSGNDTIYGNGGGDAIILGGSGNDKIYIVSGMSTLAYADGEDGDDVLLNNTNNGGDSILRGGDGDDNLHGGVGKDILTGGSGADKFVIKSGEGSSNLDNVSIVTDFKDNLDKILLVGDLAYSDLTIVDPSSEQRSQYPDALNGASKLVFEINGGAKYLLIVKQDRDASISEPFLVLDSNDFETGGEIR
jgi:serralysin